MRDIINNIKTKTTKYLSSNKGASIILSLVIFLAAAMVSLVIVNAALTNAQRIRAQKHHEQAYLMLSSTASMLETMLSECSVDAVTTKYREYDTVNDEWGALITPPSSEGNPNPKVEFKVGDDASVQNVPGVLKTQLEEVVKEALNERLLPVPPTKTTKKMFSMSVSLNGSGVEPIDSDWYFENDKGVFSIIVVLKSKADEDDRIGKIGYNNIASYQTVIFKSGSSKITKKNRHEDAAGAEKEKLITEETESILFDSCVVNSGLDTDNEEIKSNY